MHIIQKFLLVQKLSFMCIFILSGLILHFEQIILSISNIRSIEKVNY